MLALSCVGSGTRWVPLCLTPCDPMSYSPPGSSAHRILRARILEWVVVPFASGSSRPRDWTCCSCIAGRSFTAEPPEKPSTLLGLTFMLVPVIPRAVQNADSKVTRAAQSLSQEVLYVKGLKTSCLYQVGALEQRGAQRVSEKIRDWPRSWQVSGGKTHENLGPVATGFMHIPHASF